MGEVAVDVTVTTRFADPQTLMSAVGTWIERGCLRVPALIECGPTFVIALVTSTGEIAVRGTAEAVRQDGKCTWVRFLSAAASDQEDGGVWFDLVDADVTVPPTLATRRVRVTASDLDSVAVRARSIDNDWAIGTPLPEPPDGEEHTHIAPPPAPPRATATPRADGTPARPPVPEVPKPPPRKAEVTATPPRKAAASPPVPPTPGRPPPFARVPEIPRVTTIGAAVPPAPPAAAPPGPTPTAAPTAAPAPLADVAMTTDGIPVPIPSASDPAAAIAAASRRIASPAVIPRSQLSVEPRVQPMAIDTGAVVVELEAEPPSAPVTAVNPLAGGAPTAIHAEPAAPPPVASPAPTDLGAAPRGSTIPPPMVAVLTPGPTGAFYVTPATWTATEPPAEPGRPRTPTVQPVWSGDGAAMPSGMWVVDPAGVLAHGGSVVAPLPTAPPPTAPARPSRAPMTAAVAIAAAGAIVAISAVLWARGAASKAAGTRAAIAAPVQCETAPTAASRAAAPSPAAAVPGEPPASAAPAAPPPPPARAAATHAAPTPSAPAIAAASPGAAPEVAAPDDAGPCAATFTATATDVQIFIDGRRRGVAPTTLPLPCEPTAITFRHQYHRYVDQVRRITPSAGGTPVHVVMQRPKALLKIVSKPAGAEVAINGHAVGKTPTARRIDAFESITVTMRAPGMATERRLVYPKAGTTVVAASLKKKKR